MVQYKTHIAESFIYLSDDGHLIPAILFNDGTEGCDARVIRGDGTEEVGKAFRVREGDGCG